MDEKLFTSLSNYITPDLVSKASTMLGESEKGVSKGLSSAIPMLLGGLIRKADDPDVMNNIMNIANQKSINADKVLSDLSTMMADKGNKQMLKKGNDFMQLLFGEDHSGLFDTLSGSAGIKKSSAMKLLSMVAPLILSYIKKSGMSVSGLTKSLFAQKDEIARNVPEGMNSLFGLGDKIADQTNNNLDNVHDSVAEKPKNKWLWPVIIIAVILLIFYFMGNRDDGVDSTPASDTTEAGVTGAVVASATQAELDESYELGANPDAETIAKFEEKAGKTFSQYRGYCYDEKGWLNTVWEVDRSSAGTAADDHKTKTGHKTGVRWK